MSNQVATTNGENEISNANDTLRGLLTKMEPQIRAIAPKHVTPERLMKLAIAAYSRTPMLQKCSVASFLNGFVLASQLGLEIGGPLQHAHLIPFRNSKTGGYDAQFIVGFQGLIQLARQSGDLSSLEARAVYANDDFDLNLGTDPFLKHRPKLDGDRGELVCFYGVANFASGGFQIEVMSKQEVDKVRNSSRASKSGPWVDWYEQMGRKTVIRRLLKYCPMSTELATAVAAEDRAEAGESVADLLDLPEGVMDGDFEVASEEPKSTTGELADLVEGHNDKMADSAPPADDKPASGPRKASKKAIDFMRKLAGDANLTDEQVLAIACTEDGKPEGTWASVDDLPGVVASKVIEYLKGGK